MDAEPDPRRLPDSEDESAVDEDRWIVVKGRRWRRTDPGLDQQIVDELKSHLGRARNAVKAAKGSGSEEELRQARDRVNTAKHGLGERGDYWWDMSLADRVERAEEALERLG